MYFFFLIVVVALVTVFSLQNANPVSLSFLVWRFDASLAIVVFLSVLSGILIMGTVVLSGKVRKSVRKSRQGSTGPGSAAKPQKREDT